MKQDVVKLDEVYSFIKFKTKMNDEALAEAIGMSRQGVSDARKGKSDPTNVLNRLMLKFPELLGGMPIKDIVTDELGLYALSKVTMKAVAELLAIAKDKPVTSILTDLESAVDLELTRLKEASK